MFKGLKFYESALATIGAGVATGALTGLGVGSYSHMKSFKSNYPEYAQRANLDEKDYLKKEEYRDKLEQLKKLKFNYDMKMDDCETTECFDEYTRKINDLNERIYGYEEKLLNNSKTLSYGLDESALTGALVGGLAGAGVGYLTGTLTGMTEAERVAYLKLETTKRIRALKNELNSTELDMREQIKFYKDNLKNCNDTRCIDDIRDKIQILKTDLREKSDAINKEIMDLKINYRDEMGVIKGMGVK